MVQGLILVAAGEADVIEKGSKRADSCNDICISRPFQCIYRHWLGLAVSDSCTRKP